MLLKSLIFCIASLSLAQAALQWNFWNNWQAQGIEGYNSQILNSDGTVMSSGGFASFVYFRTLTAESLLTADYDQILADMVLLNNVGNSNQIASGNDAGYFYTGFSDINTNYTAAIGKLSFVFIANNQTLANASEFTLLRPYESINDTAGLVYPVVFDSITDFPLDNKDKIPGELGTGAEYYWAPVFGTVTSSLNGQESFVGNYKMVATRVVPEPGTATLGLVALAGLVLRRRRRA